MGELTDPLTDLLKPLPGWASCPVDVLLVIFSNLSPKDLIACLHVNTWWRDAVDYMGQHCRTWQGVAQAGMNGGALTIKCRSTLNWRDTYFNYRLWHHLPSTKVTWGYILNAQDIRYVHIYKDFLIVQTGEHLKMKCYKIDYEENSYKEVTEKILLKIEDERLAKILGETVLSWDNSVDNYCRLILKIMKQGPFKRLIVADDNSFYILNERNILMCFKWLEDKKKWEDLVLARYFGCYEAIADIHIYDEDIYLMLKTGTVFRLDRKGRYFEPLLYLTIEQYRMMQYTMLIIPGKIEMALPNVGNVNLPPYSLVTVLFHKFSAVIGVSSDREFKVTSDKNCVILEIPDLTCATKHGDVLLLGFRDGRVEIGLAKNLVKGEKPEVRENVQNYHNYLDHDPAIVAIDVLEVKGYHRLFVATRSHIYDLLIQYPEHIRTALGVC